MKGTWTFEADSLPTGEGTRVTWRWVVHPANAVGRLVMPVFGRLWHGYARRSLAHLETLLTSPRRS